MLHKARKEVLEDRENYWVSTVWPDEMTLITRISEDEIIHLNNEYQNQQFVL